MADTLYATHGGFGATDMNLYAVNPATIAAAAAGDTGRIFTGLAFDPTDGTLYGVTGNLGSDQKTLFSLDETTGAATLIGALGDTVGDICFDDAGQMYGWKPGGASSGANRLTLIDKATGGRTDRAASGLTGTAGGGLTFLSGVLYVAPKGINGELYTADTTTGAVTDLGPMTGLSGDNVAGMTTLSGVLWGIGNNSGRVFTVGAISGGSFPLTVVGTLDTSDSGWDSLAASLPVAPPPPPPDAPEGVCIALTAAALGASPTWTRLD